MMMKMNTKIQIHLKLHPPENPMCLSGPNPSTKTNKNILKSGKKTG